MNLKRPMSWPGMFVVGALAVSMAICAGCAYNEQGKPYVDWGQVDDAYGRC